MTSLVSDMSYLEEERLLDNGQDPFMYDPRLESEQKLLNFRRQESGKRKTDSATLNEQGDQHQQEVICTCGHCAVMVDAKGRQHKCCQGSSFRWKNKLEPELKISQCVVNTGCF